MVGLTLCVTDHFDFSTTGALQHTLYNWFFEMASLYS